MLHILYIYIYIYKIHVCVHKSVSTALDKGLRKNNNKETETGAETEMEALHMKQKKGNKSRQIKLDKNKISSYGSVVFKHGCS